jgi:protein-S-isoprenylcysteine O-methyltransferase Ste14
MIFRLLNSMPYGAFPIYKVIVNLVLCLCVITLFIAIIIDVIKFYSRSNVKREKKSVVETGTMTLFFFCFYFLILQGWGTIHTDFNLSYFLLSGFGVVINVLGCIVNIKGRMDLGKNWANQIKIYQDHSLVQTGVYRILRHPLYASLIWMFYGACFVQFNISAFIATTLIFVPFMTYRARQEEALLSNRFSEYQDYQAKTGMFFPRIVGNLAMRRLHND